MARLIDSAGSTSKQPTTDELRKWYAENKEQFEKYTQAQTSIKYLRDVTKAINHTPITTFDKEKLRRYLEHIDTHEKEIRGLSRFLYYRSHIYFRLVQFYANMFDLKCRLVTPNYSIGEIPDSNKMLKNYNASLDILEKMNLNNSLHAVLERCFIEDVCYSLFFLDDNGAFFYILDPSICCINGHWNTGNFSFAIDMSKYDNAQKKKEMEFLGEPLTSMYAEYKRTGTKLQTVPSLYSACFKFRDETWDTSIPPFIALFNSLINLSDLENIQAIADEQQIYKLVYYPMKVISGSKDTDDFAISPDIAIEYFNRLLNEALPDYAAGAIIPGDELGVVDFSNSADNDTDRVQKSQDTILNTSGGGMVLNTSRITTQAGFDAALKVETEFAISSLLPQIDGFANMVLIDRLGKQKACNVKHLELSVYTRDKVRDDLLKSNQYSFSNRLAYNTCLGISEKQTMAFEYLENTILKLPEKMNHPLTSSFTSSGNDNGYTTEIGQGAPRKDDTELTDDGSRSRDQ